MRLLPILILVLWAAGAAAQPAQPPNPGPRVNPWGTYYTSPPTLTNGQFGGLLLDAHGNLMVDVSSSAAASAPAQQTPVGDTSVSVPAATSTLVWTTSALARVLRIVPAITTCTMQADATAAASSTSTPIPGGYVWNLSEPPPNRSIYVYCPTATAVAVSQGN